MAPRVGVMGGTFDPVHIGHLRVAEEAVEALSLDTFLFIPAAEPPHKPGRIIQPFEDRLRMLEAAIAGHPLFHVSDVERTMPGKSYTVLTLRRLRREYPGGAKLFFLVGLDAFWELSTWYHYRELFELASIVVLRRPGYPREELVGFLRDKVCPRYVERDRDGVFVHPSLNPVFYLNNTPLGVSSSQIRRLVSEGRSIRYLVPEEILRYILQNKLYEKERPAELDENE